MPGGVDIFLLIGAAQQRLLRNERAQEWQGRATLLGSDNGLPVAGLLIVLQRFHVDIRQLFFRRRIIFLRNFQLCGQQRLLAALRIVQFLRQLVIQIECLLRFTFLQQCTNGK
ncbi:hypothetical protein D3C78_875440 [compost metagenome]